MPRPRTPLLAVLLLTTALTAPATASDSLTRWVPERCWQLAEAAAYPVAAEEAPVASDAELWNRHYRDGFSAVADDDLERAELEMCQALIGARRFPAEDWRYAETLDELGLIYFELGELETAERMQGAAVAEILLVRGPARCGAEAPDCRDPSLPLYLGRLGIVHAETGRAELTEAYCRAPYRILGAGYLPLDASLRPRVERLIGEYLRREDLAAADWLRALLEGDPASP